MTITSTHSNYNFYTSQNTIQNISVDQKTSQNTAQNNKLINSENSVTDKSQAVNKVLGYGVDSEGYFTSDFNEAAGLPKDYRIYAKSAEDFVNFEQGNDYILSTHSKVDFAKTLGNAYKIFSQLISQNSNSSFSQEDLQNLPYAYKVNRETLEITQIYNYEEYKNSFDTDGHLLLTFNTANFPSFEPINSDSIFNSNGQVAKLDNKPYLNSDGSIDKGGLLIAFANNTSFFGVGKSFLEGETKLLGKLIGLDNSINKTEIKEFYNFMNANKLQSSFINNSFGENDWNLAQEQLSMQFFIRRSNNILGTELSKRATELAKEYKELINSHISLDEFKEKYLDFKERHDEFVKDLEEAEAQTKNANPSNTTNTKESEEENKKSFTPIQVKSKTQTYTREEINKEFFLNFIENQKENSVNILELLNKFSPNLKVDLRV